MLSTNQGCVFACQKGIFAGIAAKTGKNLAKMVITGKIWQKVFFRILLDNGLLYQYNIIQIPKMKISFQFQLDICWSLIGFYLSRGQLVHSQ